MEEQRKKEEEFKQKQESQQYRVENKYVTIRKALFLKSFLCVHLFWSVLFVSFGYNVIRPEISNHISVPITLIILSL
jgi:hypothetical protein